METVEERRVRQTTPEFRAKRRELYLKKRTDPEYMEYSRKRSLEWYYSHRKLVASRLKNQPWYKNNRRSWMREYERKKRQNDLHFRLRNRLHSRLWHAIIACGGKKAYKTMELIGCTLDELRLRLQSQFTQGMNWEKLKAGAIHIDHKKPCALFDLSKPEEQKACFNFHNLQPLWAFDNQSKHAKFQ